MFILVLATCAITVSPPVCQTIPPSQSYYETKDACVEAGKAELQLQVKRWPKGVHIVWSCTQVEPLAGTPRQNSSA